MAYSRDPALLFQSPPCGFSPPLNFESNLYNGSQPVSYEKQTLLMPLGCHKDVGDRVEAVVVDWIQGHVKIFHNTEEAMNGIGAKCIEKFRIPASPASTEEYIQETLGLLRRGHSLTHPQCTCLHEIGVERCKTLGISHPNSEYNRRRQDLPCSLSRRPREFSSREVSKELGIEDVVLFQVLPKNNGLHGNLLLPILSRFCNLRMDGMSLFFSYKDFAFGALHARQDLIQHLSCNPFPLTFPCHPYPEFARDVNELEAAGLVHVLARHDQGNGSHKKQETEITLFYFNPRWNLQPVDSHVAALWHGIDGKDLKATLEESCRRTQPFTASLSWSAVHTSPNKQKKRRSANRRNLPFKKLKAKR